MSLPDPDTADALIDAAIGALASALLDAETYRECEARRARRNEIRRLVESMRGRARTAALRAAARQPLAPVAACLARSVSVQDRAGQDALLARPKTNGEWRQLALILAAAADPARLAARERRAA